MRWFQRLSIRAKLILIILVASISMVVLMGSARIAWDVQQAREALAQELSALTRLLADRSSAALAFEDADLAEENLAVLQELPHVVQACLYRSNATLLADYWRDPGVTSLCPPIGKFKGERIRFEEDRLHVGAPIRLDAQSLGWIYLGSDLSPVKASLRAQVTFSGLSLLAAILITGLLAVWLQRLISVPIAAVTNVARAIEEKGDHRLRAPVVSHDEVGQLARGFNSMLDALQKSETKYQKLFDTADDAIFIMHGERITDCNPRTLEMFDCEREEIVGSTPMALSPDHQSDGRLTADVAEENMNLVLSGKPQFFEWVHSRSDGTTFNAEVSLILLKLGDEPYLQAIVRDVTERRQTEEALRRSQKMEAIGQLSGGIAHDFNNQLGVVIGYLDFLREYFPEHDKPRQWVETATRATLRCMDLTRQLLAFSRRQVRDKSVVDLNATLKEMETIIARSVTPEVEVQYVLASGLWQTDLESGDLQDAVLNLVINARDAMPDGGKLLIETDNEYLDAEYASLNHGLTPGDYVRLVVSDTGTGMDAKTQEHIFEPFFTTKSEGKGTGLGMAMVYGFVKRYGGYIKVYSELGVGSAMRLYLPRSTTVGSVVASGESDDTALPVGNETILIVDDEPGLLALADHYLADLGYHTHLAESAAQALAILKGDQQVDLLFTDVVMPGGMNGYELAQKAIELRPDTKVLLTSGFTSKAIAQEDLSRFSINLLGKPYRKADLALRVRQVLNEKSVA